MNARSKHLWGASGDSGARSLRDDRPCSAGRRRHRPGPLHARQRMRSGLALLADQRV